MKTLERIRFWAESTPEQTAYRYEDLALSYGALWERSRVLAEALRAGEIDTCVLYGGKEPEMLIGMIGCLLAGVTYVPITDPTPALRIREIISLCQPQLVLSSRNRILDGIMWRSVDELTQSASVSGESGAAWRPAYIIFTSGSTGTPKGVPISRENLDNFTDWILRLQPLAEQTNATVLNQANFSFDLSVADIYYALCGGHTLQAMPKEMAEDHGAIPAFFAEKRVSVAVCTPTFLKLCLLSRDFCESQIPFLKTVYSCGEQLEPSTAAKLLHRFPKLYLINAYGPTEATSAVCASIISMEDTARKVLPAGKCADAACNIQIQNGEIVLSGKSVFRGYLGGTKGGYYQRNSENYFRTGDLGEIREDTLYCFGRLDRQVKWKGYRIEPEEIEAALQRIPFVKDSAVIPKKNADGQVRFLKAFVVLEDNEGEEDLRERLKLQLPEYMIPKTIIRLSSLPKTENGKCDRKELEIL